MLTFKLEKEILREFYDAEILYQDVDVKSDHN